jgi:nucleoside-diphosphate-sugar epimerase
MILVTGGSGLVGSHLMWELLRSYPGVRAVHRAGSDLERVRKVFGTKGGQPDEAYSRIEWIQADLTDIPALEKAFEGVTQVYHAGAYVSFNPKHYQKLRKSNVEGTANVVNLCLSNKVEKLCYVSSIATLGNAEPGTLADEQTPWSWEDDNNTYAISKYQAELEVWRGTQEGLKAVIVNLGVILGEGHWHRGSGSIVSMAARGGKYYTSGGVGVVDVQDVVSAMIRLMRSNISAERYVLVGHNLSYKNLMTQLAKALELEAPVKLAPRWMLSMLSRLDWLRSKVTGSPQQLFKASVTSLYNQSYYDNNKLVRQLDFEFTPLEQSIQRIAAAYREESLT